MIGTKITKTAIKVLGLAGLLLIVIGPVIVGAQSFDVLDKTAQPGMLMSATANQGVAEPASDKSAASLVGVLAPDVTALDAQAGQSNVQTDGVADALVSTLNGDIRVGDRITASSLVGIGAKATGSGWIVGIAQGSLDAKTGGAITSVVKGKDGQQQTVYISRIQVLVKVTYYAQPGTATSSNGLVPTSVQEAADRLAGKHVRPFAILLSFLLMLVGIILAAQLINSAVRSGFAAISRQPLTKRIILNKVLQAFVAAAGIVVLVFIGAYLILRLV